MDDFPINHPLPDRDYSQISRNLFQDSIDPILFTNITGEIFAANNRAQEMFAIDSEAIPGMNISILHREPDELPDLTSFTPGNSKQYKSTMLPGNDQGPIFAEIYLHCYQIDSGLYLQWIFHDITRREQLDNIRKDLTATLVHDLQGPLGNVLSSLELVKGSIKQDENPATFDLVEIALHSSQHLQWLVNTLLDISRLEAGYPIRDHVWIDINSLIDHVYAVQQPEFEQRQVILTRSIAENARTVKAQEDILRRILLNLLNNALKYSNQDQKIIIGTKPHSQGKEILFTIEDQGQGIPQEFREVIFEKYQRIDNGSYAMGLGLGLAFCRLAVEAHGGRIWVEESAYGGACFCFTLPVNVSEDTP